MADSGILLLLVIGNITHSRAGPTRPDEEINDRINRM